MSLDLAIKLFVIEFIISIPFWFAYLILLKQKSEYADSLLKFNGYMTALFLAIDLVSGFV